MSYMYINSLNFVWIYCSMVNSSMSKSKLGPQESEENGKFECVVICAWSGWGGGGGRVTGVMSVVSYLIRN